MLVSVQANVRTAEASRKGLAAGLNIDLSLVLYWNAGCGISIVVNINLLLNFIKIKYRK
jgi:Na+/H+-translocating membrane pyrophosphatase